YSTEPPQTNQKLSAVALINIILECPHGRPIVSRKWSTMTKKDTTAVRNSSASTESWKSSDTIKPTSLFRGPSRRGTPMQVKIDSKKRIDLDPQISPTSSEPQRQPISPASNLSNVSPRDHRISSSGFGNYRRDLSVLETSGGRIPQIQHNPPTALQNSSSQVAPWMLSNGSVIIPSPGFGTSFYNDSSDNLSMASQLSPSFRPGSGLMGNTNVSSGDSPADPYFGDERRPSVASVTTASSTGSKSSAGRGGNIHKKLQTFFGEDYLGRKEGTPIPSSEDISKYGEAPIRANLSGPDRDRYTHSDTREPPKTSSSSRSHINLPGHHHRYNRSNEDPRSLRPSISREDSAMSVRQKERVQTSMGQALANSSHASLQRPVSPTPSSKSNNWSVGTSRGTIKDNNAISPTNGKHKHSILSLGRFARRHKDKDPVTNRLMDSPTAAQSSSNSLKSALGMGHDSLASGYRSRELSDAGSIIDLPSIDNGQFRLAATPRTGAFRKNFKKGGRTKASDDLDGSERSDNADINSMYKLDTNLENMEGILAKNPPLTPLDNTIYAGNVEDEAKLQAESAEDDKKVWEAPDSWGVANPQDTVLSRLPEVDESGIPAATSGEKANPHFIRIFRADDTYQTISAPLNATVNDIIGQLSKKSFAQGTIGTFQIVMKKHSLQRVLGPGERPIVIQKRLLEQAGYTDKDKIEEVNLGGGDNSYLCRFSFVAQNIADSGTARVQKNDHHVNLEGDNLVTIPISLYLKSANIVSLNLSRNLSLDLPNDFVQSCQNLRELKYISNEAWNLPSSLKNASRLTILDVSNNRLERLEQAGLEQLQALVSLKLANNRLKSLPAHFGAFRSMRTLNLSSNFLDFFPEFLCDLKTLIDLDMSFNYIASVPAEIQKLNNLERFAITNNRLTGSLPETFSELLSLKEVDVRYNALTSINVIAQLPKVENIAADHNSVSVCEAEFTHKIRVLRLNSNPVTKFEILNVAPGLTLLNLSNAKLAHIPDAAFDKMPNLIKLVLDNNHFVSLPSHIGKLRKLEFFSIAKNALNSLPIEIGCLTELKVLDIRQNNLKKLPMEIWWANKLETLNISSNVLDNFPKSGSRPPQVPGDVTMNTTNDGSGVGSQTSSFEELGPLEAFGAQQRRPSQASGLLSVGTSPVPINGDRKGSLISLYGKGGRKTSVVSRSESQGTSTPPSMFRKDSGMSAKLLNTFAGSLRNLYVADNQLDDDVFQELDMLSELRVLNLSYNDLNELPPRTLKKWPHLQELYLSGNELTSLPSDDIEESSYLQTLHINGNKFQTLPAELGKAHRLAVLDCGSNSLKYNVSNWPYDWNWNWNTNLKYLNLSGNKRLEIKPSLTAGNHNARGGRDLTGFGELRNLRILGLMDVTLTISTVPDQTEDRRVRTSDSYTGQLAYGMADTLGNNGHLSIFDTVVPKYNGKDNELLLGMFDGQTLSNGGSKIAKYLHENFSHIFNEELKRSTTAPQESPIDALRRTFLSLNKDLATAANQHTEQRSIISHRGSSAPAALSQEDLQSGGVATVMFLQESELYVANIGDAQAMLIHSEGGHRMLTQKHDPAEPNERARIRDAGGWVSKQGKLNDILEVSRAFGYVHLMPAVHAAPHISRVTVKEQDEMILIASREVWEYLSPDLVVDVARYERGDLMRAAQRIRDLAIAFGASGKLLVMMIGVSDLKKRAQRPQRVQSLSFNPSHSGDEPYTAPFKKRPRKGGEAVEDSTLRRLPWEVQAPVGDLGIVFTDIKSSTLLWETYPNAMRSAIKLHNEVMRRQLRIVGGYEVKTEGDAFMVSFPTATSALLWTFAVQQALLEVEWPSEVLESILGQEVRDTDGTIIFKGLSVRMGAHWGAPVCENDPVTRRMDYFGPMVNRASRISGEADGGQITVSADFISEIQRCLETYNESDRLGSAGSEEAFDNDLVTQAIRRELRSLSSQGFEVKDIGERKLKGLENPEFIYLMYPHALSGRTQYPNPKHLPAAAVVPGSLTGQTELNINADSVWGLWSVSLRLEMLCSSLEGKRGEGVALQPPETSVLDKMKASGGEITDRFLVNFVTHQVSRIETCISTLATRYLGIGAGQLTSLDDMRAPMDEIFAGLASQLQELAMYKTKFGELDAASRFMEEE
ncbi:hypothetical protein BJ878DRAFT_547929, partial [Calycina marina]